MLIFYAKWWHIAVFRGSRRFSRWNFRYFAQIGSWCHGHLIPGEPQNERLFMRDFYVLHSSSAHALCALFSLAKKRICAFFLALCSAHQKKVRARINLHIQHPSAGNRHFLAHTRLWHLYYSLIGAWRLVWFFERNVRFSKPCASADSHIQRFRRGMLDKIADWRRNVQWHRIRSILSCGSGTTLSVVRVDKKQYVR